MLLHFKTKYNTIYTQCRTFLYLNASNNLSIYKIQVTESISVTVTDVTNAIERKKYFTYYFTIQNPNLYNCSEIFHQGAIFSLTSICFIEEEQEECFQNVTSCSWSHISPSHNLAKNQKGWMAKGNGWCVWVLLYVNYVNFSEPTPF